MASTQGASAELYQQCDQYLQKIESRIDLTRVNEWLGRCTKGDMWHRICSVRDVQPEHLPKRLIGVGESSTWPCVPRLVESAKLLHGQVKYIALSHSWGTMSPADQEFMSTTVRNLESHCNGIVMEQMPAKYQAVMILCRRLEIKYLWIDSLCIVQGEGGDWSEESARMAQYYGFAFLSISINTELNLLETLSKLQDGTITISAPKTWPRMYSSTRENNPERYFFPFLFWREVFEGGPISRRGWCLQERHLSPRMVHLIDNGLMLYECESAYGSTAPKNLFDFVDQTTRHADSLSREGPKTYWRRIVDLKAAASTENFNCLSYWHSTVDNFQGRVLKYGTDNLVAIYGLAEMFHSMTDYTYLSGLWKEDLPRGLLWCRDKEAEHDAVRNSWERFGSYQGPSWSWCSVNGPTTIFARKKGIREALEVKTQEKLHEGAALLPLVSVQNVNPVSGDSAVAPLQPESYIELGGMLKCFRYVCGQWKDTGHLESDSSGQTKLGVDGSVIFDIPSDWRDREVWSFVVAGYGERLRGESNLGLALELVHWTSNGPTATTSSLAGFDGHQPGRCDSIGRSSGGTIGCFRRLGLALLTLTKQADMDTYESAMDEHLEQLKHAGFELGQIRVY